MSIQNTINAGYIKSVFLKNSLTDSNGVEISDLVTEVSIYQSIQVPFITGKILIVDAISLLDNVMIIGNEQVDVNIAVRSTSGKEEQVVVSFITTSIEKLEKRGQNNVYALTLGSAHMINNAHVRVNQALKGKSSDMIKQILTDKLGMSEDKMDIEESSDNLKLVVPNLKVADALMWIARRASSESGTPYFVYEYLDGSIAFNSLAKMYSRGQLFTYYRKDVQSSDPLSTYKTIIDMQVDSFGKGYKNFSDGMFAAKVYAFDVVTKQMIEKDFNLTEYEKDENIANTTVPDPGIKIDGKSLFELPEAKVYHLFTSSDASGSTTGANEMIGDYHTNAENKVPYLNSKLMQLENFMMTIVIQGNINIFPGALLTVIVPSSHNLVKNTDNSNDLMYSGNYIVASVRHVLNAQNHTTYVQLAKDSLMIGKK